MLPATSWHYPITDCQRTRGSHHGIPLAVAAASRDGGDERIRTADPLRARQVLSQLSYIPNLSSIPNPELRTPDSGTKRVVGLGRVELPTSRLSGVRSNQLSYRPDIPCGASVPHGPTSLRSARFQRSKGTTLSKLGGDDSTSESKVSLERR